MNTKQKFGCLMLILRLITATPLYYGMTYLILEHVQATTIIWVLFWIWAPVGTLITLVSGIGEEMLKKEIKD